MSKKITRGARAGQGMAMAMVEWIHLMYQLPTARRVLDALIAELIRSRGQFEDDDG